MFFGSHDRNMLFWFEQPNRLLYLESLVAFETCASLSGALPSLFVAVLRFRNWLLVLQSTVAEPKTVAGSKMDINTLNIYIIWIIYIYIYIFVDVCLICD